MDILFYFYQLVLFIFFVFWLVFLPGNFLLNKLKITLTKIETITVSLAVGVTSFTLLLYIFASLGIRSIAYIILSFVSVIALFWLACPPKPWRRWIQNLASLLENKDNFLSLIFIFSGTVILGSLLFRSGWAQNGGLSFTEYRDSFWHLGLMKELVRQVPPFHPGFAPQPLTNYHYFTHLFGAGFLSLPFFNSLDFYFRIFPFFLTLLYGLSLYIIGRMLTKSVLGANLTVLFGYFTGSFAYVLPLFIKYPGFNWHESSFWLSQPFSMVINPSFALSSSLFLVAVFLLNKITQRDKTNLIFPLILISGTLISFKVYAGLLILGGLLVSGIWYLIKEKKALILISFIIACILSLFLFLPTSGKEAGKFLVFLPGWFLRSMVESPDRVQIIDWVLRENTYGEAGNMLAILRYRLVELVIYLVGNLGIRILGLIIFLKILKNIKQETATNIFLLVTATTGLLIPLLFVQDGSIANTVQFSYYSLIIFDLWLATTMVQLLTKRTTFLKIIIVSLVFVLAIPTSIKTSGGSIVSLAMGMGTDEIQALMFLKNNTKLNDIILVPATYRYTESLFVGTLSNRRLYYSDRLMAENTHKNFRERETLVNNFFSSKDTGWNTSFLKNNKISYVYVDKEAITDFDTKYYSLEKVFGNKKVDIYKVL